MSKRDKIVEGVKSILQREFPAVRIKRKNLPREIIADFTTGQFHLDDCHAPEHGIRYVRSDLVN